MRRMNIDGPLLIGLLLLCALALVGLYSAVGESMPLWLNQVVRLSFALIATLIVALMPPDALPLSTP